MIYRLTVHIGVELVLYGQEKRLKKAMIKFFYMHVLKNDLFPCQLGSHPPLSQSQELLECAILINFFSISFLLCDFLRTYQIILGYRFFIECTFLDTPAFAPVPCVAQS